VRYGCTATHPAAPGLLNFAGNAVKFTEQGSIMLRAILLQDQSDELLVRFEVQDTGIGIDTTPRRACSRLRTGRYLDTRKYGGTAGLVITAAWCNDGGEIGVDSTREAAAPSGSPPACSAATASCCVSRPTSQCEIQLRQQHSGARILLAEDNLINREVALELLHGAGLAVDTATMARKPWRWRKTILMT